MEHRFKYEPDEHLNSPMLYQNVGCNGLKMSNCTELFRVYPIMSKKLFQIRKLIFQCQERITELSKMLNDLKQNN